MTDVSNRQDVLDVRDIIERFEELDKERELLADAIPGEGDEDTDAEIKVEALKEWDEDNGDEWKTLKALLEELNGDGGDHQWKGDWYPVTLIRDTYFVDAMRDLVQEIGDLPKNIPGYLAIDWEQTADNLRADYSSVEYDDVTYWYR